MVDPQLTGPLPWELSGAENAGGGERPGFVNAHDNDGSDQERVAAVANRIRSIKPEFWRDYTIGQLSRDARLLFLACWSLADDEGLLEWNAPRLRGEAFLYDPDITLEAVESMMAELQRRHLVFAYTTTGVDPETLGFIVNFRKHQSPQHPSPSKKPLPPLNNPVVARVFAERDNWRCLTCGDTINPASDSNPPIVQPAKNTKDRVGRISNTTVHHHRCLQQPANATDTPTAGQASLLGLLDDHATTGPSPVSDHAWSTPTDNSIATTTTAIAPWEATAAPATTAEDVSMVEQVVTAAVTLTTTDSTTDDPTTDARPQKQVTAYGKLNKRVDDDTLADILAICDKLHGYVITNFTAGVVGLVKQSTWADTARLMLSLDNWTRQDIETFIDYACTDEFWRPHVRTMKKLRHHAPTWALQREFADWCRRTRRPVPGAERDTPPAAVVNNDRPLTPQDGYWNQQPRHDDTVPF